MSEKEIKRLVFHFLLVAGMILAIAAGLVFFIDPFFHYHKPWFGIAAVQNEKEYQIPGVLAHLDYDNVLLGSSVVMGIDTDVLEGRYSGGTVKAVANTASVSILTRFLDLAYESHDLDCVFYGLDLFSFYEALTTDVFAEEVMYLVNHNPLDDVHYLWNGEVLAEKIPDMLRVSRWGDYSWGKAYSFNDTMKAGPDEVLASYYPTGLTEVEQQPWDYRLDVVEANLNRLETIVAEHPETEFLFFLPPYPIVWWDRAYNQGLLDSYRHTYEICMERLLPYENVKVYATRFNEEDLITDMYQYLDVVHGAESVTDQMVWDIGEPSMEITAENYKEEMEVIMDILWRFKARVDAEGVGFIYEVKPET